MKSIKIAIDNLKCGGCENTIIKGLKSIEGVENVKIEQNTNTVEVIYIGELKEAIYFDKLARMGYPTQGTSNTFQKAKSYVSCALGKLSN